jgi:hypothetical protein
MGVEVCSDCTGIITGGGQSLRDREPICRQPGGIWKKEKERGEGGGRGALIGAVTWRAG